MQKCYNIIYNLKGNLDMSNKKDNSNDLNNKVKKKKRIVYGEYKIDRKKPIYLKNNEYKKGLTTDEVEERKENLQVNIDGVIESNFSKTIKIITKVFVKNTFTFFNILYIIVLILLLIAKKWNNPDETNLNFAITDFMFLAIVSVNLIIGIIQETKSKLAINKLKLVTNPKVTLIRNGEKVIVEETEVVLDDIMYLTPGIQIVSDSILLEGEVEVNESQLTGESVPIKKRPGDMIYSGSFMVSGTSYARVEHVGKLNEINKLTSQAKKYVAPNSQILSSLKKLLVTLAIFIVVTSLVMFFSKWPIKDFIEALNSGSLDEAKKIFFQLEYVKAIKPTTAAIIGMIPTGLYLLTSVALSVGVVRLSKNNTLVQDVYCIEMLARVNVLCLDKTGTITNGKMSIIRYEEMSKNHSLPIEDIISSMNAALQETNATAQALVNYFGTKAILKPTEVIPFSSERKYSAVSFGSNDNYIIGAPEFVLKGSFEKYASIIGDYANQGLRVICLAQSSLPFKDGKIQRLPRLIALILIEDQIREEAYDTIQYFKDNGVEVKVISGDNPVTVSEVARRVGIENADKCISLDGMSDDEIIEAATKFTVFGRVKPEQKKLLVTALKNNGKTVAMTGDGVNDIPALKTADCSIAMASGNDAVKNVAQLVLVDSNFSSMPKVVAEGRRVINNVQQTAMLYLVKTLFMTVLAVLTAIGFFKVFGPEIDGVRDGTFPFAGAKQLLIVEMFAIGLPSIFLAVQSNNSPVKGNFLKNALKSATPGAVGVVCAIVFSYMLSKPYGFTVPEIKTVVAITATFTILIVMCRACVPFTRKKIFLCVVMWALSLTLIVLSMQQVKLFSGKIDMYDMFGFDSLTWEIKRIEAVGIDKEQEYLNATALWLSVSMVIISLAVMLGVELLMKNFELNREINKNKVKEQEKRKNPTIKKIKY